MRSCCYRANCGLELAYFDQLFPGQVNCLLLHGLEIFKASIQKDVQPFAMRYPPVCWTITCRSNTVLASADPWQERTCLASRDDHNAFGPVISLYLCGSPVKSSLPFEFESVARHAKQLFWRYTAVHYQQ